MVVEVVFVVVVESTTAAGGICGQRVRRVWQRSMSEGARVAQAGQAKLR